MDLWGFLVAIVTDWVSLMSGIATVLLTILGFARDWQNVPRSAFWTAGLICFFFASVRIWTREHVKSQGYPKNSNSPYVLLRYLPVPKGASGFMIVNDGAENAIRVHINDIQIDNKVATFGEFPSIKGDGQERGTYPEKVMALNGDSKPDVINDLHFLFVGLPTDRELAVTVDYWAVDNIREFRTTCVFHYYHDTDRIDMRHASRALISPR